MDRSFSHTTTMDENLLCPIFLDEIYPGDTISIQPTIFLRMLTALHPIMSNVYIDVQFFFSQNRNVWEHWPNFMGEAEEPDDEQTYTVPTVPVWPQANTTQPSLSSYMGLPYTDYQFDVNALPFRHYRKIYDEWYRDANLQNRAFPAGSDGDGPDPPQTTIICLPRGKRKDYFSGALPWPQAGDPVTLPLGLTADLNPVGDLVPEFTVADQSESQGFTSGAEGSNEVLTWNPKLGGDQQLMQWSDPKLEVDLSTATAATINQIREAFQVQKLLERDARGGRRYSELILAHFGVQHPDAQWRPEFLGSFSFPLNIQQVAQTSSTQDEDRPLGDLGAFVVGGNTGRRITKSFTEHGYVFGIASIRSDLIYHQGIERHWKYETRYDYYWPAFAMLGEQEIRNYEIYMKPTLRDEEQENAVFGYQERYGHLRYKQNMLSQEMKPAHPLTLATWHLAEEFEEQPVLNGDFIVEKTPIERVVAVQNERHFLVDAYFKYTHVRPMPMFGIPGLVDHF